MLLSLLLLAGLAAPGDYDDLRALIEAGRAEEALEALEPILESKPRNAELQELKGEALSALGQRDGAAYHLGLALRYTDPADKRSFRALRKRLDKLDPLNRSRRSFYAKTADLLSDSVEDLVEEGHEGLAAKIIGGLLPHLDGKERDELAALSENLTAGTVALDLDEETDEDKALASRPLVIIDSKHYRVKANLERELAELIADTMDGIFEYYVEVFVDGDEARASFPKATLRIYPTWATMIQTERGDDAKVSPGLGGWWSPAENKVVCYDTRDRTGSLDFLLSTLFHEASHQFMAFLCLQGRGFAPAWINEGTGCFFEGAVALKGGGVLWPDASVQRLRELSSIIQTRDAPEIADVIAFNEPGSYEGRYYPYGWALVYYMMEFEDPQTGTYPLRPLYSKYREKVTTTARGSFDPLELFEETFLGDASPLGHADLKEFEAGWRTWILGEVKPLHIGRARRDLRLKEIEKFLTAADEARDADNGDLERRNLQRALAHAEFIVSQLDIREVDGDILETQLAILERLERPRSEAAVIDTLLDLSDSGEHELDARRYDELERRLKTLDRGYAALRLYKSRKRLLLDRAQSVLDKYSTEEPELLRRASSFAMEVGTLLDADSFIEEGERLLEAAEERDEE